MAPLPPPLLLAPERAPSGRPLHRVPRGPRELVLQALGFEGLALFCVTPLFHAATRSGWTESFGLLALSSVAMMLWSVVYNSGFDRLERRLLARCASERTHALRIVHALGFEGTGIVVSAPLLVRFSALGWGEAVAADLALSLAYAGYGYLYHLAFDRLRSSRSAGR